MCIGPAIKDIYIYFFLRQVDKIMMIIYSYLVQLPFSGNNCDVISAEVIKRPNCRGFCQIMTFLVHDFVLGLVALNQGV